MPCARLATGLLVLLAAGCVRGGFLGALSDTGGDFTIDGAGREDSSRADGGAGSPDGGACGPWLTSCSGSCVDLKRDALHCGACGHGCGAGQVCADGRCSTGYYISPSGSDSNPGTSSAKPWLTFAHAIPLLVPGDTLLLMDGEYTKTTTGLPDVACGPAKNGTEAAPITLRSQHERRAHIKSDGSAPGFHMSGCSFWVVEGLYVTSADLGPTQGGHEASVMQLNLVSHLVIRRNLVAHSNRFFNNHGILVAGSDSGGNCTYVLVEDNEVYSCRRWLIAAYHGEHIIERRNYTNSKRSYRPLQCQEQGGAYRCTDGTLTNPPPCDSSLWCFPPNNAMPGQACAGAATAGWWCVGDPSAHNISTDSDGGDLGTGLACQRTTPGTPHSSIVENNIDEGSCTGIVDGCASQAGTENRLVGNMALGSSTGTHSGHYLGALGTIVANNLAVNTDTGFWTNGSLDFSVSNNSSFTAGGSGFFFGQDSTPAEGVDAFNNLATDSGSYATRFSPVPSTSCTVEHNNLHGGTVEIPGVCTAANNTTLAPSFLGTGANQCLVYVPGGFANSVDDSAGRNPCIGGNCGTGRSNMAGAGRNGADIGANLVFGYQDGVLTRQKLWNPKSGVFLGCDRPGAVVEGVNDEAQTTSCINVHKRLNVGANGCPIP